MMGKIIGLLLLVLGAIGAIAANEPIELEAKPCYLGVCLVGDSLKLELCLNGQEENKASVKIDSPVLVNGVHEVEVDYTRCKTEDLPLRHDLKNENYTITITTDVPPTKNLMLQVQRFVKSFFKDIKETKNYKREPVFEPKFPEVELHLKGGCTDQQKRAQYDEIKIILKDESYQNYECKSQIQTRRFAEVRHANIRKIGETDNTRVWESDSYLSIKSGSIGQYWQDVEIFTEEDYDFLNATIVPICKIKEQDVIVEPEIATIRCPAK